MTEGLTYDAFVSYSHAADDLLAPRLQAGLQRFAKPWWRRRAVRVFRDESSLSASPHLWGSITEALDSASWFVLLLSPEAASSEWVNKEIDYWKSDRSRTDRVLPVVTDGEFGWVDGDVVGSSVPPALRGVFESEPRWVDLRFAKGETQLDLKNPEFAAAVADVSSAIRGIPKDELESEEVKQHRRTIRTAWAAGILVLLLGVAASIAAVFAFNEQARANENEALALQEAERANQEAERANQNAELANQEAERANQNAEEANQQRAIAEREAAVAQAREIVLEAEKAIDDDPELGILLSLFALEAFTEAGENPAGAVTVLRTAVAASRTSMRLPGGGPLAAHPTQPLIATTDFADTNDVIVIDVTTGDVLERYVPVTGGCGECALAFSDDGNHLAHWNGGGGETTVWNRSSGEVTQIEGGGHGLTFSPDGQLLAWGKGPSIRVEVWSFEEERIVYRSDTTFSRPDFGPDGLLAYGEGSRQFLHLVDPVSGQLIRSMRVPGGADGTGFHAKWSPDGSRIATAGGTRLVVVDVETGSLLSSYSGDELAPRWLPAGDGLIVGDAAGLAVFDAETGEIRFELPGLVFGEYVAVRGTSQVAAVSAEGGIVLFDALGVGAVEVAGWLSPFAASAPASFIGSGDRVVVTDGRSSFVVAAALDGGDSVLVEGLADVHSLDSLVLSQGGEFVAYFEVDGLSAIRSTSTGEVIYRAPPGWELAGLSGDGSVAVIATNRAAGTPRASLISTEDGSTLGDLTNFLESGEDTDGIRFFLSHDGEVVGERGRLMRLIESGPLFVFARPDVGDGGAPIRFSSDGGLVVGATSDGLLNAYDLDALVEGASEGEALLVSIRAHDASIVDVALSPDGTMALTTAAGDPARLWELTTGRLLSEFGGPLDRSLAHHGAFHPTEQWVMIVSPPNQVRIHTLAIGELIFIAESRLTREMTEAECQQYFFQSSCPG